MQKINENPQKFKGSQKQKPKKKPQKRPKKISADYLHNAGLYYLQRFAASAGQFRKVMTRKIDRSCLYHQDQDRENCLILLNDLIERFQEIGLLNDDLYGRALFKNYRNKGYSRRKLDAKLKEKGLEEELIKTLFEEEKMEEGEADLEYRAALLLAKKKKIGPFALKFSEDAPEDAYEKHLGRLARAGFSYDICKKILDLEKNMAEKEYESHRN